MAIKIQLRTYLRSHGAVKSGYGWRQGQLNYADANRPCPDS
jgi:hypothetical protein